MKAASDLTAVELCLERNTALDAACFHAQQAAERYLKAYLIAMDVDFPSIHELEKLIGLCVGCDPAFATIKTRGQNLTPYAVVLRYDVGFWPSAEIARDARDAALAIEDFVMRRLPPELAAGVEWH